MGPANRKMMTGRGDKGEAADTVFNYLIEQDLEELKEKYDWLDEDDQQELREIFGEDEDIDEILENESEAGLYLTTLSRDEKRKLMENLFAFQDAHPVNIGAAFA